MDDLMLLNVPIAHYINDVGNVELTLQRDGSVLLRWQSDGADHEIVFGSATTAALLLYVASKLLQRMDWTDANDRPG